MFNKLISNIKNNALCFIVFASLFALSVVFTAELVLNLNPCMLCLYQRFIYLLLLLCSLLGLLIPLLRKPVLFLISGLLFCEIGFAAYHVAIEHYLIEESYICGAKTIISSNFQKFLTFKTVLGSCSEGIFKFMNFSMAEWNVIYSCLITFYFMRKK